MSHQQLGGEPRGSLSPMNNMIVVSKRTVETRRRSLLPSAELSSNPTASPASSVIKEERPREEDEAIREERDEDEDEEEEEGQDEGDTVQVGSKIGSFFFPCPFLSGLLSLTPRSLP